MSTRNIEGTVMTGAFPTESLEMFRNAAASWLTATGAPAIVRLPFEGVVFRLGGMVTNAVPLPDPCAGSAERVGSDRRLVDRIRAVVQRRRAETRVGAHGPHKSLAAALAK